MDMATLRIPQEQWAGFEKLVAVDDESLRALASTLREEFPGLNKHDALAELTSRATSISYADARDVMGVLTTLYLLRARQETSIPDFVEDVLQAMDQANAEELKLSGNVRDRFRGRLADLLNVQSASVESKAVDVQFE